MADRKDPVTRFLELLRFRTVSGEGPQGSYAEVSRRQSAWISRWIRICCCCVLTICVLARVYALLLVRKLAARLPRREYVLLLLLLM